MDGRDFDDWRVAPNIVDNTATYELENEALRRDGRLERALFEIAPWDARTLVDVGCGTGFWLAHTAERAANVIGVEPDLRLLGLAAQRTAELEGVEVRHGSAEHLPVDDGTVDVAHARFAYFFGAGADAGLVEVERVLAPGGVLLAIDNCWSGGDFARLLRASTTGNATIDPNETHQWWLERGARRHQVDGGWTARSPAELDRILRIEFPADVVSDFMTRHRSASLSYQFAVFEWTPRRDR